MGFNQCPRLGTAMLDNDVQFNLIIPFTDYNYCNLEGLTPLYTVSNGSIIYTKTNEIGEAFEKARFPIARNCSLKLCGTSIPAEQLTRLTQDGVIYIPFTCEESKHWFVDAGDRHDS